MIPLQKMLIEKYISGNNKKSFMPKGIGLVRQRNITLELCHKPHTAAAVALFCHRAGIQPRPSIAKPHPRI